MEGNKRAFLKKLSSPQFKKKGVNRKGKSHNSIHELLPENFEASETVYRILCHTKKIGSVIGKGGSIIRALRENTKAKIIVADSVPGSDERVILVHSPSSKGLRKQNEDETNEVLISDDEDRMELHCAAQDALLKVHDRIVEEDLGGPIEKNGSEIMVTARLLVSSNMVGCILGKKGDVIQKLRSETGASIRVLPSDQLPTCAVSTDELIQISGKPALVRKALYDVSTLLYHNPRKGNPPSSYSMPYGGQGFHPPGPAMMNMHPHGSPIWSRNTDSHGMAAVPWMGEYGNHPSGFEPGGFNGLSASHGGEVPSEFLMKILCSAARIGGVIGKGGSNVKQLQQETGASIHVEDVSPDSDERVICVSSFEALHNPRSQTIDAILLLQNKTSEFSDKGIMTRLLVPSSKVGCILGQGGQVINEMRRRTQADIRVFSKEDKPKCASENEELVQIFGSFSVAKDALVEICSRLRARCLRDAHVESEPTPSRPISGYGLEEKFSVGGRLSGATAGISGGYESMKGGGREYEPPSYPVPLSSGRFPNTNRPMDMRIPNDTLGRATGTGWSAMGEMAGARFRFRDPLPGDSEYLNASHGSYQGYNARQAYGGPSVQSHNNPQHVGSYQTYSSHQGAYPNIDASQSTYQGGGFNPRQASSYENLHPQHSTYHNIGTQGSYQY